MRSKPRPKGEPQTLPNASSPRQELETTIARKHPDIREVRRTSRGVVLERAHRPGARDIEIDTMGESVLARLDGRKTLETLRIEFAAEHCLSPLESRALLLSFLRDLKQRELIQLVPAPPSSLSNAP
ncbi:MAG: hypothetical protein JJU05_05280 [Verrucomicrobia bacterium]|nr:hypothetical protein [Verrucomicrobiota bacterium]MCH8525824.1 hypothetical protein [Kiritimatiellia bacterium]